MKKVISLVCVVLALMFVLAACSPTPTMDELTGVYSAEYTFNGTTYYRILTINADGSFVESSNQANGKINTSYGKVEIDGSDVNLRFTEGGYTTYEYSDGKLEATNYTYIKK